MEDSIGMMENDEIAQEVNEMNEKEIVREIMQLKGYNQTLVAEKAGLKRQSNVAEMLRSRNLRVDNLIRLLEAMDCELVIRSKTSVVNPDSGRTSKPEWIVEITE